MLTAVCRPDPPATHGGGVGRRLPWRGEQGSRWASSVTPYRPGIARKPVRCSRTNCALSMRPIFDWCQPKVRCCLPRRNRDSGVLAEFLQAPFRVARQYRDRRTPVRPAPAPAVPWLPGARRHTGPPDAGARGGGRAHGTGSGCCSAVSASSTMAQVQPSGATDTGCPLALTCSGSAPAAVRCAASQSSRAVAAAVWPDAAS